jgi:hypothetical protein
MQLTLTVPDELLAAITRAGGDPGRAALESLALEAYRERRIDACQLRTVLGISSDAELGDFLSLHQMEMREVEVSAQPPQAVQLWATLPSRSSPESGEIARISPTASHLRVVCATKPGKSPGK